MAFKIITDSATDLPKEIIDKYQLHVIPTPVTIDGTDYFDGKTIFPEEFYRIQADGADIKTYHINQYMFRENFEPYAKAGDEVLYLYRKMCTVIVKQQYCRERAIPGRNR